jgi:hypothetical protein
MVTRNEYIFKTVIDTNIKQLENSMQTHEVDLEILVCAHLVYKCQCNIWILPTYATTMTHQRSPWPMEFILEALEGTVVYEARIPGLSHNPINTAWSKVWGSREPRNWYCSVYPRCHFPLTVIRMTLAADTLHQCC